jgi:hypothetical protein
MPNTPTPEPQRYADAQLMALLDPSSKRDTILITPGSPMPSRIPDGLTVARTSRGIVITSDPAKVKVIDQGSERDVGMALFGYAHDQSKGFDNVAVAMDRAGTPVAELAIKPGQERQRHACGLFACTKHRINEYDEQGRCGQHSPQGFIGIRWKYGYWI